MRIGSLCTGYGGLDMAVQTVLGGEVAWVADPDPGAAAILAHHHPHTPNLGDIRTADWETAPPVDVLTAGFPCQDVSVAGRRAGLRKGTRTGLWLHVLAAIEALRPPMVVIENVPGLRTEAADSDVEPCPWCVGDTGRRPPLRALGAVLAGLAGAGFDAEWASLPASAVGAPHRRERVFVLAWPADAPRPRLQARREGRPGGGTPAHPANVRHERGGAPRGRRPGPADGGDAAADAEGDRRDQGRSQPAGEQRRPDAAQRGGAAAADRDRDRREGLVGGESGVGARDDADGRRALGWGPYASAVARWEHVLGRRAPAPTRPDGRGGAHRLNPVFVEWLMGLPAGHVTDPAIGLSRTQQLRALGNGVVPQQGAAALRLLLERAGLGHAQAA